MRIIRKHTKSIALFFIVTFFTEILYPVSALAITGHSSMPEYRSFEPVATSNMVNMFDGSFTYNIPLLDVPNGYPINLSYHSNDINNEAQASWVGMGWTLNPGAINRVKKGFADEFKNQSITYHSKMPKNWTVSAGIGAGLDVFGKGKGTSLLGANLGTSIRYNNYNGIGTAVTGGVSGPAGLASLNFSYSQGHFGFDPEINPGALFNLAMRQVNQDDKKSKDTKTKKISDTRQTLEEFKAMAFKEPKMLRRLGRHQTGSQFGFGGGNSGGGSHYGLSFSPPVSYPTTVTPYEGVGLKLKLDIGTNLLPAHVDLNFNGFGSYVQQKNAESTNPSVYGYLHLEGALNDKKSMMDYSNENEKMYEKRDKILSIPLPNNDVYSVTGEALGGTFRPFRTEFGHYRKNYIKSETFSVNVGADFSLPIPVLPPFNQLYTYGGNLGADYQSLKVGNWDQGPGNYNFRNAAAYPVSDENVLFRFSSDLGGFIDLTNNNDQAYSPELKKNGLKAETDFDNYTGISHLTERSLRSSYISQHTFNDFNAKSNNVRYKVYEKNLKVIKAKSDNLYTTTDVVDYHANTSTYNPNGIAEFATYNADGVRYVYGLPIHTKDEKSLSYSLQPSDFSDLENYGGLMVNANPAANIHSEAKRRMGYESATPYATQYLLTQIVSPDYVDRNLDGLTPDDFGSYSKFNYIRVAGGEDRWFPFRSPHTGLNYEYGSLSEKNDNMGSYEYGEKELYYLRSICSKTHVAVFTLEDRQDAASPAIGGNYSHNDLIKGNNGTAPVKQKALSRIDLYSIESCHAISEGVYEPNADAVPLKTVRFKYNYSLCKNLPNNSNADVTQNGKLTLEKIWFEYEGKLTSKIAPYIFHYKYPTFSPGDKGYTNKYNSFLNEFGNKFSDQDQNPNYNILNTDRWGNYRNYADMSSSSQLGKLARFFPFTDQDPSASFDPAAWCLKRIQLPSGGEIHVQYEQNDYQYVQNKKAMIMVPLHSATKSDDESKNDKKYYIDLSKVGINLADYSDAQQQQIVRKMFEPVRSERLYFNFLYKLIGDGKPDLSQTMAEYNAEYIEGYARIEGYGIDDGKPFLVFKEKSVNVSGPAAFVDFVDYGSKNSKREIPQKVCKEFYKTQRRGKVNPISDDAGIEDKVWGFLNSVGQAFRSDICMQMDPEMSYVRLQTPQKKLGGGIRVKRLLMYDDGTITPNGEPSLYGNEYTYNGIENGMEVSYGVATNEPGAGRRESSLCNPIAKDEQSKLEAFLYGRDMYSQEGPLGEGLMPSPSIGYSKIIVKNIHEGATSTGFEEHEFYTCKDYPFLADYTTLEQVFKTKIGASVSVGGVGGGYSRQNPYMVMGYVFITNEMHGQKKRIAKYATGQATPIAEEIYEYFQPGENIRVMNEDMIEETMPLGKETEILGEAREVEDIMVGGDIGIDVSTGAYIFPGLPPFLPPFPIPLASATSFSFNAYVNEQVLRTHVTTKIIRYPAIVKKVTNKSDGVTHVTQNLVLDKFSGTPVITRSFDDFEETYTDQEFMASWSHKNMRPVSLNERMKVTGVFKTGNTIQDYLEFNAIPGECSALDNFAKGDFLELSRTGITTPALYHVSDIDYENNRLIIIRSGINVTTLADGNTVGIDIIESGYTNQLNSKSGLIKYHGQEDFFKQNPPPLDADIQALLNQLNGALASSGTTVINKNSLPSTLRLVNPQTQQCVIAPELPKDIYVTKNGSNLFVDIGEETTETTTEEVICGSPLSEGGTPHPLVTDLNNFLTKYWGYTIPVNQTFQQEYSEWWQSNVIMKSRRYTIADLNVAPLSLRDKMLTDLNSKVYDCINNQTQVSMSNYITVPGQSANNPYFAYQLTAGNPFKLTSIYLTSVPPNTEPVTNVSTVMQPSNYTPPGENSILIYLPPTPILNSKINSPGLPDDNIYFRDPQSIANYINAQYTSTTTGTGIGRFDQDANGCLVYHRISTNSNNSDELIMTKGFTVTKPEKVFGICFVKTIPKVIVHPRLCRSPLTNGSTNYTNSSFTYNEKTGYVMFISPNQCPQKVSCLKICPKPVPVPVVEKVIAASALTFSDDWNYNATDYPGGTRFSLNLYESGAKGKWRTKENFVFRKPIDENGEDKNFNKGRFTLTLFNWQDVLSNDPNKWVKLSTVTKYSPNGDPLEDKNLLEIYSTSKFGYNNTLPVLVAQNAPDHSVAYESFEKVYLNNTYFEDGLVYNPLDGARTTLTSHTGNASIAIRPKRSFKVANIRMTNQVYSEGLVVRAWFKSNKLKRPLDGLLRVMYGSNNYVLMKKISGSGEWSLYEGTITPTLLGSSQLGLIAKPDGNYLPVYIRVHDLLSQFNQGDIFMDDVKVQPLQSEMVCYVYDNAQRLLAVLDDQHYAMVYEYNSEGILVRKLKETEKGLKTVSETQYNTKGEIR